MKQWQVHKQRDDKLSEQTTKIKYRDMTSFQNKQKASSPKEQYEAKDP